MQYIPSKSDLLDMSVASLQQHTADLLSKWSDMTPEQRREFREIGLSILTNGQKEAAA